MVIHACCTTKVFSPYFHVPYVSLFATSAFPSIYGVATFSYIDLSSLVCAEGMLLHTLPDSAHLYLTKALSRGAQDM